MNHFNHVVLAGDVHTSPAKSMTEAGSPVLNFQVSVSDSRDGGGPPARISVSLYGGYALAMQDRIQKGSRVIVFGRLSVSRKKNVVYGIRGDRVILIDEA